MKGVKAEDLATRPDLALALAAKIEEVPDGITMGRRRNSVKGSPLEIKIDAVSPG